MPLTVADARRALAALGAAASGDAGPLETSRSVAPTAPRTEAAAMVEGDVLRAHPIGGDDGHRVAAFLDGRQVSRIVGHVGLAPIVHAVVGAVVRRRRDRTLATWAGGVRRMARLYASRAQLTPPRWEALVRAAGDVVDTTPDADEAHPIALVDRAYHRVQEDRERLEGELAAAWAAAPEGLLYVDGGISKHEAVAASPDVVGVVKSHRTLYAVGDGLGVVAALRARERSSVFAITSARRTPVHSWYLRLRAPEGRGPLWGLVRLEAAVRPGESPADLAARADALSRAVAAEIAPLSLPDARWPVLAYGIRDCEQYLTSILSAA